MLNNSIWRAIAQKTPAELFPTTIVVVFCIIFGPQTIKHLIRLKNQSWQIACIGVYLGILTALVVIFIFSVVWYFRMIKYSKAPQTTKKLTRRVQNDTQKELEEIKGVSELLEETEQNES